MTSKDAEAAAEEDVGVGCGGGEDGDSGGVGGGNGGVNVHAKNCVHRSSTRTVENVNSLEASCKVA